MIQTAYQLVKDLLAASETQRKSLLSDEQWILTQQELERQKTREIQRASSQCDECKGKVDVDLSSRGFLQSSMRASGHRRCEKERDELIAEIEAQHKYAISMIAIERQKLHK